MKIDGSLHTTGLSGSTPQVTGRSGKGEAGKSAGAGSTPRQDSVSLSNTSSQIQALETSISEASGFDAGKVEAIKQAISEGKFKINPEQIADKLINSARELIAQQKA